MTDLFNIAESNYSCASAYSYRTPSADECICEEAPADSYIECDPSVQTCPPPQFIGLRPFGESLGVLIAAAEFVSLGDSWGQFDGISRTYFDARNKMDEAVGLYAAFLAKLDEYGTPEKLEEARQLGIRQVSLLTEAESALDYITQSASDNPVTAAGIADFRARVLGRRGMVHEKMADKEIHPDGRTEGMNLAAQSFTKAREIAEEAFARLAALPEGSDPVADFQIVELQKRLSTTISAAFDGQLLLETDGEIRSALLMKIDSIRRRVDEINVKLSGIKEKLKELVPQRLRQLNLLDPSGRQAFLNMLYRLGVENSERYILINLSLNDRYLREKLAEFGVESDEFGRFQLEARQVLRDRASYLVGDGLRSLRRDSYGNVVSVEHAIEQLARARELLVKSAQPDELIITAAANHALALRMRGDDLAARKMANQISTILDSEIDGAYEAAAREFLDLASESSSGILQASFVDADGKTRSYIDEIREAIIKGRHPDLDAGKSSVVETELAASILERIAEEELRTEHGRKWLCSAIKLITNRTVAEEEVFNLLGAGRFIIKLRTFISAEAANRLRASAASIASETGQRAADGREARVIELFRRVK